MECRPSLGGHGGGHGGDRGPGTPLERFAKGGKVLDPFGLGVDVREPDFEVLSPVWHEAPAHQGQAALAARRPAGELAIARRRMCTAGVAGVIERFNGQDYRTSLAAGNEAGAGPALIASEPLRRSRPGQPLFWLPRPNLLSGACPTYTPIREPVAAALHQRANAPVSVSIAFDTFSA